MNTNILALSSQWTSWRNQGATTQSQITYDRVKAALDAHSWPVGMSYDVYLQGSYRNSTNIRGDSDVDIVVELPTVFQHNVDQLPADQQQRFHRDYPSGSYTFFDFHEQVRAALYAKFGSLVRVGNKCINVGGENDRLNADVVPALNYRKYNSYTGYGSQYAEGMRFYALHDQRWVINYPKLHYQRGVTLNSAANGEYKPGVRWFKNARNYLVDNRQLEKGQAPSYFIECALSNVPAWCFTSDGRQTYERVFAHLVKGYQDGNWVFYTCQNGVTLLFGDTPEQWDGKDYVAFLAALRSFWS